MAVSLADAAGSAPTGPTGECLAAADLLLARATAAVRAHVAPRGLTDSALLEREQHAVGFASWNI